MGHDRLDETLRRLHAELSENPTISRESRELLEEIARDIQSLADAPPISRRETSPFVDRLREATARFEESHPSLAEVVARLSDVLSKMGI